MSKISFKVKVLTLIMSIIGVSILTSFLSANYYIKDYISESNTQNINAQLNLVKDKLVNEINNNVKLAKNSNVSLAQIKESVESTGFNNILKLSYDVLFDKDGSVEDSVLKSKYISQINSAKTQLTISNIYYEAGIPYIDISIYENEISGTVFVIDLSQIRNLLETSSIKGSYLEIKDSEGNILFSDKKEGDLIPIESTFNVGVKEWTLTGYIDKAYIQADTGKLNGSITIALLVVAAIIIPLSVLGLNIAFQPIISLRNVITNLANGSGDLTHRLKVETKDDLGKMADGINRFIESLQLTMLDASASSENINTQINLLEQQTSSNQQLLEAHHNEMEMAATSIHEMSSTAVSVAESAANSAKQTEATNIEAEQSKLIVQQAVSSVTSLVDEVDHTSQTVSSMSEDTNEIGNVLNVIGEIAEQTNLLALNAAIEAARAGEHGRGFAVVADEVRALAARTRQSTIEINLMLEKLSSGSKAVAVSMGTTKESCMETANRTSQVTNSLEIMNKSIFEINNLTTQIATSAEEQSSVTEEINRNIIAIQEMIGTLTGNGIETVNSTRQLNDSNQQLVSIINKFKLA